MSKQELINYVVNSHVRNELDINELLRLIHLLPDETELNENQQEVLEWLQLYADKHSGDDPLNTVWYLIDLYQHGNLGQEETIAYKKLNRYEEFQVLAAFAEWGKEKVAE